MEGEKDRFGEKMRLVEKAKEDIYFAEKDRELVEKLKARLKKIETQNEQLACPKCPGRLESYSFMDFLLDRCQRCGGVWLDRGELVGILRKASRSPLASLIERFIDKEESSEKEGSKE